TAPPYATSAFAPRDAHANQKAQAAAAAPAAVGAGLDLCRLEQITTAEHRLAVDPVDEAAAHACPERRRVHQRAQTHTGTHAHTHAHTYESGTEAARPACENALAGGAPPRCRRARPAAAAYPRARARTCSRPGCRPSPRSGHARTTRPGERSCA